MRGAARRTATFAALLAVTLGVVAAGCTSGGGSTKAFCEAVQQGDNPVDLFDRYDPANLSTAREQLQLGVDRLRQLQRAAPSEISDDLGVLIDVGSKVVAALDPAAGGSTPPDLSADADRVKDASTAVTTFAANRCGVDLQSPSSPPQPGVPSSGPSSG